MRSLYILCSISIISFIGALAFSVAPIIRLDEAINQEAEHGGAVSIMLFMQTAFPAATLSWVLSVFALLLFRSADIESCGVYRKLNSAFILSCRIIVFSPLIFVATYIVWVVESA
ncbi:hypothetical protein ACNKU7_11390 [Microbulbifer sp. SA54]|uniref:hypothetical protein n=1 Tax=Microbulbifer sp. SA54 TaxID=3401577 RepID=UPI003AAD2714